MRYRIRKIRGPEAGDRRPARLPHQPRRPSRGDARPHGQDQRGWGGEALRGHPRPKGRDRDSSLAYVSPTRDQDGTIVGTSTIARDMGCAPAKRVCPGQGPRAAGLGDRLTHQRTPVQMIPCPTQRCMVPCDTWHHPKRGSCLSCVAGFWSIASCHC